jgi:hypothetical protein
MTTNYVFPCGSVAGLTLSQKRDAVKALRESIRVDQASRAVAKAQAKLEKALARAA